MIRLKLTRCGGHFQGFSIRGHAGYDDYGRDIVCAAASILSHTLMRSLMDVLGWKTTDMEVEASEGNMCLKLLREGDDRSDLLFCYMERGFASLREQYGQYLEYEIEEE